MKKRHLLFSASFVFATTIVNAQTPVDLKFQTNAAREVSTHSIISGDDPTKQLIIGIDSKGGGYINKIQVGYDDIMNSLCKRYGRGGQSSLRDTYHRDVLILHRLVIQTS